MSRLQDPVRILWSLAATNLGTSISGPGNSGGYNAQTQNACTTVDLRTVEDILLTVTATATPTGTSPTLSAQLDIYDDQGNLISGVLKTANLTGAGSQYVSGGVHGATAAASIVLPSWGRISWTVGGTSPVFPSVEISLFGR